MTEEILQILIKNGVLDESKLQTLPQEIVTNPKALEEELLKLKLVTESDLIKAKSLVFNVPYFDLSNRKADPEVLREVPENTVRRYRFIPIEKKGDELTIGMVDPGDVDAREALKFVAVQGHFTPKIYIISQSDLDHFIGQYRTLGKEVTKALQELEQEIEKEESEKTKKGTEQTEEISAEAPITKVVAVILRHAVEGGASDIHIEPLEDKTRVRFRVDGILHSSIFLPTKIHTAIVTRIKILSNLKIDEARMPQDGRFNARVADKKIDFRVSTFPTPAGEKAVLRVLDPTVGVGTFEDLGLIGKSLEIYQLAIKKPFGLVLITGPTGSGKSTTLYTTLNDINSEKVNVVTLEDPIEYYIEGVNQSQIRPEIKYTFASGLRSILRQDPDIIMVGEIRDKETASLATHAALTGHLVFSTLHTNDAVGIISRLVNMDVKPYLLPPTLIAGVAQRLLRKLCQECIGPIEPSPAMQKIINDTLTSVPEEVIAKYKIKKPYKLFKSKGCPACGDTGVKGRVGVFEIFEMTPELESIVLSTISETKLKEEAKRQGMITIKEDGIMKALKGLVAIEEILRVTEQ
jgi:type IV pilus assembly protein PilB